MPGPSPFTQLTVDEKTLLHLSQFLFSADDEAPFEATQEGIAEATGISTTHVPRSVQGLRKKGLVQELRSVVGGGDRRRKVYLPTEDGYRKAQELKVRLLDAELIVREPDGHVRVATLRELHGPTVTVPQVLQVVLDAANIPFLERAETRQAAHASPTSSSLYTRIPQVGGFVGRKKELKELQDSLKDPRVRLIVVTGIAGIGKTTLVAKSLSRQRREDVFWYRLHEWDTLRNMGFVMGDFLAQLGKPEFKQYMEGNREHDVAEAYEIVRKDLEGLDAVFVLDDFDKAPRSLVGFIRTFLPHLDRFEGIRLITITRASIPFFSQSDRVEGRVVELTLSGLSEDEAKRLLPGKRDDARTAEVTRITEGHPLLIKLFANVDTEETRIEDQLVHTEGPSRFVAEEILSALSTAEMRALEAACVHRYPIPPEVLFISPEVDFDVIDALRRKQLLRPVGGRFVEPVDFVREFVYQRLKPEARKAAHESAARALASADIPGGGWEVPRHLLLAGSPQEAAQATLAIAPGYLKEGKTERLWALLRDLLGAEGVPREEAGQLADLRSELYQRAGDTEKADEWQRRAKAYRQGRLVSGAATT